MRPLDWLGAVALPRLVPLLVLAIVLAGCSNPPAKAPATSTPAVPVAPLFGEPVPMPQVGGGEPNIAVTPDGTLFVASPAGGSPKPNVREGSAFLWRSHDGKAWETLRSPNLPMQPEGTNPPGAFCSCDSDVIASPDGWVYYADWWIAGVGPGQYIVEASSDGGDTWTANSATIPENLIASVDREWLVAGPAGYLALFYSYYGSTPSPVPLPVPVFGLDRPGQAIEAVYSHDHGATWTTPTPVVPASGAGLQIAHPFFAANGTLLMPYGRVPSPDGSGTFWYDPSEVRLAYSIDEGKTWKDTLLAKAPLGFDNLWAVQGAADASTGESTVVWAARDDGVSDGKVSSNSTMGLWVKQFGPLGDGAPYLVRGIGQNFLPWATARNGTAAVGWYGGDAAGDMMKAPKGATWFAYVATARGGLFDAGNTTVSTVSSEPVKIGPICPKGAACNGDRELLDYVSLVFDAKGLLHYTYTRSESGNTPHVQVANQAAPS
jgi:hypothetical protein